MNENKKTKKDGVHGKLFLNFNGETLLCRGRLEFLEAVDELGSISAAAKKIGFSYRKAWSLVEKTNRAAGRNVIITTSGGQGGGGAHLSEDGKRLACLFREFLEENRKMTEIMWKKFNEHFPAGEK